MAIGLEVIGDSGSYQIIDDKSLYQFQAKSVYSAASYSSGAFLTHVVSGSATSIIAIRSTDIWVLYQKMTYSNGQWTIYFKPHGTSVSSAFTVEFYVFDIGLPVTASNNCGLEVYGPTGSLLFDSNKRNFKIAATVTAPSQAPAGGLGSAPSSISINGTIPAKWGFVVSSILLTFVQGGAPVTQVTVGSIKCDAGSFNCVWGTGGSGPPIGYTAPITGLVATVIDLTGY